MSCSNNCPGCTCEPKSSSVSVVSLDTLRTLVREDHAHLRRVEAFNDRVAAAARNRETEVHLDFTQFGYDWEDIKFIQDAGYHISRNSACLWWDVSLKDVF